MERFNANTPLYPMLGIVVAVVTLVYGLVTAHLDNMYYFYIALYLLYLCMGYYRACIAIIPMAIFITCLFAGSTWLVMNDMVSTTKAVYRSMAVVFTVIPGLSVSSTLLIRNFNQLRLPKAITLGMMISLNFFVRLSQEMRQIREAMKTRGAGSILHPRVLYRAFLLPLVVRVVNISDTLSASIQTRGYSLACNTTTIYNALSVRARDIVFAMLFIALMIVGVIV